MGWACGRHGRREKCREHVNRKADWQIIRKWEDKFMLAHQGMRWECGLSSSASGYGPEPWFLLGWLGSSVFRPGILPSFMPPSRDVTRLTLSHYSMYHVISPLPLVQKGRPPSVWGGIRRQFLLARVGRSGYVSKFCLDWFSQIVFGRFVPPPEGKGPLHCKSM